MVQFIPHVENSTVLHVLYTYLLFITCVDQSPAIKTWKQHQPTHHEKWARDEAADAYNISIRMSELKILTHLAHL